MGQLSTEDSAKFIRVVQDYPIPGVAFQDLTPLLANGPAFQAVIEELASMATDCTIIAGIEARGFIFAAALAHTLNVGFVPIRKKGKLPFTTYSESYGLEYGTDIVEIHQDAILPGAKVLLVDDVLATGGTATASLRLIERAGGTVETVATVIELTALDGRKRLASEYPKIKVRSLFVY